MKKNGLLLLLLTAFAAVQAADITVEGKTYHNYTVASYTAEGLTILHNDGAVTIPLEEWPADRRAEIKNYITRIERRRKAISRRPDLTTKTGAVFKKYKILRFSQSGAHVSHWGGVTIVKIEELPDSIQTEFKDQIELTKPKVLIVETELQESNFPKNIELAGPAKKGKKAANAEEDGGGIALDMNVNTGSGNVSIGTGGKSAAQTKAKKTRTVKTTKKTK